MRRFLGPLAAVLAVAGSLAPLAGHAAGPPSPAVVVAHRRESIELFLSPRFDSALAASRRRTCAAGGEPAHVVENRADGDYFTPDAADTCVAFLTRSAGEGRLPELYRALLTDLGGDVAGHERVPRAIGGAVLGGSAEVPIGNRKVMTVTPAVAFDAGFTVAYQEGSAARSATADPGQLKALAESCLGQRLDAGTCFTAGYVYGGRAFAARTAAR